MEFNSKGCILSCGPDPVSPATTVTYKKLYGFYNVPEMGGTPERLDVTNLEDGHKRSILGIGDVSDMNYGFYATKDETDTTEQVRDTWNVLQSYMTAGTILNWKLDVPFLRRMAYSYYKQELPGIVEGMDFPKD